MKTKNIIYSLFLLAIFFTACNEDRGNLAPVGTLRLSVDKNEQILTKSAVTTEKLKVCIINAENDTVKSYDDYVKEVKNEKLILPVGTYTVSVSSNQTKDAGWEKPFYAGEETVVVKAGEITSATVVCKIANVKVTVTYADQVKENFVNYETTISNSSGTLFYARDEYRSGYFTPDKLTASLALTNNDGKKYTINRVFTDIKPRYHYTIKFKIGDEPESPEGGSGFGIEVDDNAKVVTCEVVINEDDLEGKKIPVLKLSDIFKDNLLSIKVGEDLPSSSLQITSKVGIEALTVKAESDLFKTKELELFDLTHLDGMSQAKLETLGFPLLPENHNVKDITLNFDVLTGVFLQDIASQRSKKQHKFTVYAMDSLHQETELKFIIEAKPDVAIYVENPSCWSTFAVLKGFCEDKSSYFKLQIGNGSTVDVKDCKWDSEGNMTALVIGLKPDVIYKYWLASDENSDIACDPIEFTLSIPSEVPNIGFDSWGTRSGKGPMGNATYISPNDATYFWDSGNLGAKAGNEVLTDQTDEVALSSSKKAARLASTWAGVLSFGAFAAGSIYSGEPSSVTTSGATLKYGRPYQGFPTYLQGYYKYTPGAIDYLDSRCPMKNIVKGTPDTCFVMVALSTKQFNVVSTTGEVKVYPKDDPAVFAYGEYSSGKTEDLTGETLDVSILNGYAPFKIRLNYKSDVPSTGSFYILIVASASKYGDYFTGSTSSVMYVDEFSLDYDYDEKAFSQTGLKDLKPVKINE